VVGLTSLALLPSVPCMIGPASVGLPPLRQGIAVNPVLKRPHGLSETIATAVERMRAVVPSVLERSAQRNQFYVGVQHGLCVRVAASPAPDLPYTRVLTKSMHHQRIDSPHTRHTLTSARMPHTLTHTHTHVPHAHTPTHAHTHPCARLKTPPKGST
jgi:hypothetical protein